MGFSFKKIFKAPLKIVETVGEVAKDVFIDAPKQIAEDVYSGTKKTIGAIGRGTSKVGAGVTDVIADPTFIAGAVSTGSIEGGGSALLQREQFNQQLEFLRSNPYGNQLNMPEYSRGIQIPAQGIPQLSLSLPSQAPIIPSANVQNTNLTLPLIIGGVGLVALFIFSKGRRK